MPDLSDLFAVPSARHGEMRNIISMLVQAEETLVPLEIENRATATDSVSSMTNDGVLARAAPTSDNLAAMMACASPPRAAGNEMTNEQEDSVGYHLSRSSRE